MKEGDRVRITEPGTHWKSWKRSALENKKGTIEDLLPDGHALIKLDEPIRLFALHGFESSEISLVSELEEKIDEILERK